MSRSTRPGIGLVGLNIGQVHLEGYRRKGIEVEAICDLNRDLLHAASERYGIRKTTSDVYEMIADPAIGVIDLAVQPWHRWPIVAAAAEAGKHLFIQKPLAMSMKQATAMVELCERNGVACMVNQNSCFAPGFLAIEPYLNAETLGDIYYVSITNDGFFINFPERHAIAAMMVHHLALVVKWFGPIDGVFAQAHGHARPVAEGETLGVVQLHFRSGVMGLLVTNWSILGEAGHTHGHPREEVRIQGTRGSIVGHSERMTVHVTQPGEKDIEPEIAGTWFPDAFGNAMGHFLDCLERGEKPLTNGRDNLHIIQTVAACYRSVEERRMVSPDEIPLDSDFDVSPARVLLPHERATG